jgi:hypothetical protein
MPNILTYIIKKIGGLVNTKKFCNSDCPYYELYKENYQKDDQYNEDIKVSVAKLVKENEKYFIYEIERTTFDCVTHENGYMKTSGYSSKVYYEVFEKHGIFMYTSDLMTYTNAPNNVKHRMRILVDKYGIEKVTEEIAIYLRTNYPSRFGINIICKI